MARVDHKVGAGWDTFGYDKNGKTYLQPEETLFLIEVVTIIVLIILETNFTKQFSILLQSKLELWYSGTPVSVQQAYQILLSEESCSTLKYRVFSHLCRQGYRLIRRTKVPVLLKRCADAISTLSPKRPKMEPPTLVKVGDSVRTFITAKLLFQSPAAEPSDYDCIPNLVHGKESIQINFSDLQLLPESTRNRKSTYVVSKKDFFKPETESHDIEESPTSTSFVANNPLCSGKTKPLMIGHLIGNALEKRQSHMKLIIYFL